MFGKGLAFDLHIGLGLAEWQQGLALEWHIVEVDSLRHFIRTRVVLVPLTKRGFVTRIGVRLACPLPMGMI